MRFGHNAGCHQRPDRSFFFRGYQFPICARCTGVLISYLASIPIYISCGGCYMISAFAAAIMFLDWVLQYIGILESTNLRRLITGIMGGYGIMTAQILLLKDIIGLIAKMTG